MYQRILLYITYAGLFLIPFIPLYVSGSLLFPYITGKNFAFRIIVEIVLVAWVLLVLRDKKYLPKTSSILWILVAFVGIISFVDIFLSPNPQKSIWSNYERMEGLITHLHLLGFFIVAHAMLNSFKLWSWFLHTSIGVSFFISLYSILQLGGELVIHQGGVRIDGTLGNAIYLGVYFLFHIFILLFLILSGRSRVREILWSFIAGASGFILFYLHHISPLGIRAEKLGMAILIASLGVVITSIYFLILDKNKSVAPSVRYFFYTALLLLESFMLFYTATRGAILGFFFGIFILCLLLAIGEKKNNLVRLGSMGVLLLFIFGTVSFLSAKDTSFIKSHPVFSRFSTLLSSDFQTFFTAGDGKARFLNGRAALRGFKERPFGWGQESFNYVFYKNYDPKMFNEEPWFDRAHSIIFDWLIAGGILGLVAYLMIFFFPVYYIFIGKKNDGQLTFAERSALLALLGAYFIQNLTVFDNISSYILFFTILAFVHFTYGRPVMMEKNNFLIENRNLLNISLSPALLILLIFSLYFLNLKPILASKNLILAISPQQSIDENLKYFKKALSYDSFGNPEIREFLGRTAVEVYSSAVNEGAKKIFAVTARSEYDKQIKEAPADARYHYLAGAMMMKIGQPLQAISYLESARELSPKKQLILLELGSAYILAGDFKQANEVLRKTYELEKGFEQAKILYALSFIYLNDEKGAKELLGDKYETILHRDPRFAHAFAAVKQFERAIGLFENFKREDPRNLQPYLALSGIFIQMGKNNEAVAMLKEAVQVEPKFAEVGESLIKQVVSGQSFNSGGGD